MSSKHRKKHQPQQDVTMPELNVQPAAAEKENTQQTDT